MKFVKSAATVAALVLLMTATASAQTPAPNYYPFSELRSLAIGLVIIGASMGIGGIGRSSVESMARQPEMAGNIRAALVLAAALIEGVAFFALIIIGFVINSHPV